MSDDRTPAGHARSGRTLAVIAVAVAVLAGTAGYLVGRGIVHERYMDELVKGVFTAETRAELLRVVHRMRREGGVEGVLLAGTELPLILRGVDAGLPLLDTTQIHVDAVVGRLLAE